MKFPEWRYVEKKHLSETPIVSERFWSKLLGNWDMQYRDTVAMPKESWILSGRIVQHVARCVPWLREDRKSGRKVVSLWETRRPVRPVGQHVSANIMSFQSCFL
jgi:hypothetical protein